MGAGKLSVRGLAAEVGPGGWSSDDERLAAALTALYPPVGTEVGVWWVAAFWKAVDELGARVLVEPDPGDGGGR